MTHTIQSTEPVFPSSDLSRDIDWYGHHTGFLYAMGHVEDGYVVLQRDGQFIHLQYRENQDENPNQGSVVKFFVTDIEPFYKEFLQKETIRESHLNTNTPWQTNEFAFQDLNNNVIYFVQDL